jgi:hypothetical protein
MRLCIVVLAKGGFSVKSDHKNIEFTKTKAR